MISTSAKDFRSAVALAALVPERRNTIPILSQLRCRANGALEISGTDLDMTIDASVPREPGADAAFMLGDYRFIAKAVGASGSDTVGFDLDEKTLTVEAGALTIASKAQLHPDDWPRDYGVVNTETFGATLSPEALRQIARISSAISTEETRYYLNGIHVHHVDGWTYRAVATDGHRLMYVDFPLPDAKGVLVPIIIPRKTLRVLIAALGKSKDGFRFQAGTGSLRNAVTSTAPEPVGATRVAFTGTAGEVRVKLSSKTIDGTFPDYGRVVPSGNETKAVFKVADLKRAVVAVGRPGTNGGRAVRIDFTPGRARLSSQFAETGVDAGIEIAADHNAADGFSIGFNCRYLLDMLNAVTGDEVVLMLADAASPTIFKDPADTAFTAVLMPMRV